ncbi:MAG: type II secretion system F family protein [bacterium]|nr:type II secretion system F family protein [bacterium]
MKKYLIEYYDDKSNLKKMEITANNEEEVLNLIKTNANINTIIDIKPTSSFDFKFNLNALDGLFSYKININLLSFISRQFSQMFASGLPVNVMFNIFIKTFKNKKVKSIFENILNDINAGVSFYKAFSKYEKNFGSLFVNLIKVGEASGNLDKIFNYLSDYYEYAISMRNKLINVMIYPMLVIIVALVVFGIAMFFVIPKFEQIFAQIIGPEKVYKELPFITIILLKTSKFFNQKIFLFKNGVWFYIFIFSSFFLAYFISFNMDLKKYLEKIIIKIPILGKALLFYYNSIFFKSLYITLNSGMLIIPSLELSSKATNSGIFISKIKEVIEQIEKGKKLSESLINTKLLEPLIEQMLITGEKSGNIYYMLDQADKFYSRELEILLERVMKLIEPVMIIVLGGFVFILLLGLYLPIFILPSKIMGR